MVEDTITDAPRIAQFLASELTGLEQGPLARIEVADADPGAEPSPSGTEAYQIERDDRVVGSVVLFPGAVEFRLRDRKWEPAGTGTEVTIEGQTLTIKHAAAVKQAADSLRVTLADDA